MRTIVVMLFAVLIGFGFLLSDNSHLHQDLSGMKEEIARLLAAIRTLQDEVARLRAENQALTEQASQLAQSNEMLKNEVQNLSGENQALNEHIARLQFRIGQLTELNRWATRLEALLPQTAKSVLLLPLLPVSIAATLIVYRYSQARPSTKIRRPMTSGRIVTIQVTEEELRAIVDWRRAES